VDDQDQWDVGNPGEAASNNIIGRRGSTKNFGQKISARHARLKIRALTVHDMSHAYMHTLIMYY
jgi:hypothetical protein